MSSTGFPADRSRATYTAFMTINCKICTVHLPGVMLLLLQMLLPMARVVAQDSRAGKPGRRAGAADASVLKVARLQAAARVPRCSSACCSPSGAAESNACCRGAALRAGGCAARGGLRRYGLLHCADCAASRG